MGDHVVSRDTLYARFDEYADNHAQGGAWTAHVALLDRLAANRRSAEAYGWTSCALERLGGIGRLSVWGLPPGSSERHLVPDWHHVPG
jgi:hypothetical protein